MGFYNLAGHRPKRRKQAVKRKVARRRNKKGQFLTPTQGAQRIRARNRALRALSPAKKSSRKTSSHAALMAALDNEARFEREEKAANKRAHAALMDSLNSEKRFEREERASAKLAHASLMAALNNEARLERLEGGAPANTNAPRGRRKKAAKNPIHFPMTARGRPSKKSYWLLDLYVGRKVKTYIGRVPVSKAVAIRDAQAKLTRSGADRVALSGPYRTRPYLDSRRK